MRKRCVKPDRRVKYCRVITGIIVVYLAVALVYSGLIKRSTLSTPQQPGTDSRIVKRNLQVPYLGGNAIKVICYENE